jgi:hypothetical protein
MYTSSHTSKFFNRVLLVTAFLTALFNIFVCIVITLFSFKSTSILCSKALLTLILDVRMVLYNWLYGAGNETRCTGRIKILLKQYQL